MVKKYDYIIIGTGIMGLSLARAIKAQNPNTSILLLDKEKEEALHASGRNSGVLHAGFYYSSDSLKAQFTVNGNNALKEYCHNNDIPINNCGKLVVCQNEQELVTLHELERRGKVNGSNVQMMTAEQAQEIEPNLKTYQKALFSPDTASVDPKSVCRQLKKDLEHSGVHFAFDTRYISRKGNTIVSTRGDFSAGKIINCAGLYADKIAHDFGFGEKFTLIPFKGLYLKYTKNKTDVRINIYPVPNLKNPFLGVHYTKTVDGDIKIGPTAIPAFWRENYGHFHGFKLAELFNISYYELRMMIGNTNNFRDLAFEEIKKYKKNYMVKLAQSMVQNIDPEGFTTYTQPGIRAQLIDRKSLNLIQDFVVEGDKDSIHILNAVSPAFTCAFPFAEFITKKYL